MSWALLDSAPRARLRAGGVQKTRGQAQRSSGAGDCRSCTDLASRWKLWDGAAAAAAAASSCRQWEGVHVLCLCSSVSFKRQI